MRLHKGFRGWAAAASAFALLAAACSSPNEASGPAEPRASAEPRVPEEVDLVYTGEALRFVPTVESEPVTIRFVNRHNLPATVFFARLNEGVTVDRVVEAFASQGEVAAFALVEAAGATPVTQPGATSTITVEFPQGSYVAMGEGDEAPAAFEVVARSGPAVDPPEADVTVEVGEFYFDLSGEVPAGRVTLLLTNAGEQAHQLTGAPGSIEEVLASEEEPEGAVFTIAPAEGGRLWLTHEFEPGPFAVVCFFTDPASGRSHLDLGMKAEFTVA